MLALNYILVFIYIKKHLYPILLLRITRCIKLSPMWSPKKKSTVCSLILLYKRLFLKLEPVISRSHNNNFIIAPQLPFIPYHYYLDYTTILIWNKIHATALNFILVVYLFIRKRKHLYPIPLLPGLYTMNKIHITYSNSWDKHSLKIMIIARVYNEYVMRIQLKHHLEYSMIKL